MDGWGTFVNDGYGMTEIFPLGGGCRHSTALHIASDLVITEIVDPDSGKPVSPGEPGEVVYTNLVGDTQPLLRYRTRDIARLAADDACACGFTGTRLRDAIEGRVDDMIWFRGANLYPSAIEGVVRSFAELGHEYEIVIGGSGTLPTLTIRAEMRPGIEENAKAELEQRLRQALSAAVRVRSKLELLPPDTLPPCDTHAKAHRVVDKRSS
jgi:phenylacetate-CoA ligase